MEPNDTETRSFTAATKEHLFLYFEGHPLFSQDEGVVTIVEYNLNEKVNQLQIFLTRE